MKRTPHPLPGGLPWQAIETPLGCLVAKWSPEGLDELRFGSLPGDATCPDLAGGEGPRRLTAALDAYFATGATAELDSIRIDDSRWTPFQRQVYSACRRIGSGRTLRYGDLAAQIGRPRAARAVGAAMARNRTLLVIPCHRVVGGDGLRGFSAPGGLTTKQRLLDHEAAQASVTLGWPA